MKKVLILGAGGMAGHVIAEYLSQKPEYEIIRCARRAITSDTVQLDVTDFVKIEEVVRERLPNVVINCVGLLVQASQERLDQAILINSYLPHFLSRLGRECGFKLIHISTDCVFSGKSGGYLENDFRDGDTPYARTKALGEVINDVDLTLRTSIIGPELKQNGDGLFNWFMHQSGTIKGFTKTYWSGVTTIELSKFIHAAIKGRLVSLYQLTAPKKINKYDLLMLIKQIWQREDIKIEPFDGYFSDKSMICTRTDFPWQLPEYPDMFAAMKQWMDERPALYRHYHASK